MVKTYMNGSTTRKIVADFNRRLGELIDKLEKKAAGVGGRSEEAVANFDRLRKRMYFKRTAEGPDAILKLVMEPLIQRSKDIIDRNEETMYSFDLSAEENVGKVSDDNKYLIDLAECIRSTYSKMKQAERDNVYADLKFLMEKAIEYQIGVLELNHSK